ncbi:MAG: FAD-dependent monooxygenase [Clostridia bacterium]|nr:FAD-dependent monooxygenase [Clostridia bacterium]
MSLIIKNLKLHLNEDSNESSLLNKAAKELFVKPEDIVSLRAVRMSVDARNKSDIFLNYTVEAMLAKKTEQNILKKARPNIEAAQADEVRERTVLQNCDAQVVVVGMGPAGLFAAYELAMCGIKPLLIDRGKQIEERQNDVDTYFKTGLLNFESNVMFGEGGAGAFSDGKLTTRIKDKRSREVIEAFSSLSELEEVRFMAKPHVGTDRLKIALVKLRKQLLDMGVQIRFSTCLTDIEHRDGKLTAVVLNDSERVECSACILAIGQGARDTYTMLWEKGAEMSQKPFAVGVRIEHPREFIDKAQYGKFMSHPRLGAAEYALTGKSGDRGVYTFCMCPGGTVIASASGGEQVVTNGMSEHERNAENSNAAVIVQVDSRDFASDHPLAGMYYQAELERLSYVAGGKNANAPFERVGDFLNRKKPMPPSAVMPTYKPGTVPYDLHKLLPDYVANGIADGIKAFASRLKGFDMYDATLTAVESRSSSPVRINRDESMQSNNIKGLYPVGEGAGYAGGIVSAAVDGMKAAEKVVLTLSQKRNSSFAR